MKLGAQQKTALRRFSRSRGQVFNLCGSAGTGKTTIARKIAEEHGGLVLVVAPTNKAAQVLRSKGLPQAQTIHSLLYRPQPGGRCNCGGNLRHAPDCAARQLRFTDHPDPALSRADLLIVDETSMVPEGVAERLLGFGVRTLMLGDPHQLPPVKGRSYLDAAGLPDFELTDVHRQAANSPVYDLATRVRDGDALPVGRYGTSRVTRRDLELDPDEWNVAIVGTHVDRTTLSRGIRAALGRDSDLPRGGEVIVARSTDHKQGLVNGDFWTVTAAQPGGPAAVRLALRDADDRTTRVTAWRDGFGDAEDWRRLDSMGREAKRKHAVMQYGYAITCHSAQGSEWDRVVVRNAPPPGTDRQRWLYTAITRARDRVLVLT